MLLTKEHVLSLVSGARRLCLFACRPVNLGQHLPQDTLCYVSALSKGFDRVVVILAIDDGCHIDDEQRVLGQTPLANVRLVCVPNMNLDFGAWGSVLKHIQYDDVRHHLQEIALINDSCILLDTLPPMPPVSLSVYNDQTPTCWGVVKSYEISEHLQSFYIVFLHRESVQLLLKYFESIAPLLQSPMDKNDVIHVCEVGLSQYMVKNGVRLVGSFDPKHMEHDMKKAASATPRVAPNNLSYSYWEVLLKAGCLLLKKNRQPL